jgi:PilZ domain
LAPFSFRAGTAREDETLSHATPLVRVACRGYYHTRDDLARRGEHHFRGISAPGIRVSPNQSAEFELKSIRIQTQALQCFVIIPQLIADPEEDYPLTNSWVCERICGSWLPSRGPIPVVHPAGLEMDYPSKRRSDRILAPLRIRVAGVDGRKRPFEEEAITVSVNKHGACISLLHDLRPDQEVSIRNLENNIQTQFRVVGELRQVFGNRREWGVETVSPDCNIWGLDFEQPPDHVQPKALICCATCKNGMLCSLSSIEYDVLLSAGAISRHCEPCGQTTRWEPCKHCSDLGIERPAPAPALVERRKHKRIGLSMLLRIRNIEGETEVGQTVDVSKGGALFHARRPYRVGETVYLTLPSKDKPHPAEVGARIVRAQTAERGFLYAVKF